MRKETIVEAFLILTLLIGIHSIGVSSAQVDDKRFTYGEALKNVQKIDDWLSSFRDLTKLTGDGISPEEKKKVGNLGWEMQNIGFYNGVRTVEGTLRQQNYEICRLEYALALERHAVGKISQDEVDMKEKAYQEAKSDLRAFLDKFHIAD